MEASYADVMHYEMTPSYAKYNPQNQNVGQQIEPTKLLILPSSWSSTRPLLS